MPTGIRIAPRERGGETRLAMHSPRGCCRGGDTGRGFLLFSPTPGGAVPAYRRSYVSSRCNLGQEENSNSLFNISQTSVDQDGLTDISLIKTSVKSPTDKRERGVRPGGLHLPAERIAGTQARPPETPPRPRLLALHWPPPATPDAHWLSRRPRLL